MPRPFPAEFRARAIALVRAGKPISRVAAELGIRQSCLHSWVRQDLIDRASLPASRRARAWSFVERDSASASSSWRWSS